MLFFFFQKWGGHRKGRILTTCYMMFNLESSQKKVDLCQVATYVPNRYQLSDLIYYKFFSSSSLQQGPSYSNSMLKTRKELVTHIYFITSSFRVLSMEPDGMWRALHAVVNLKRTCNIVDKTIVILRHENV